MGQLFRGDSLLRTVIGGKMEGKKTRQMMLYWMMVEGYRTLKEEAQQREECRTLEPTLEVENQKKR